MTRLQRVSAWVLPILTSAALWLLVFVAAGASLLVAGIFVLLGQGAALIASGLACMAIAGLIRRGLINA